MRLIPAEPPSVARARAMAGLAQILMLGARFEESQDLGQRRAGRGARGRRSRRRGPCAQHARDRPRHARRDRRGDRGPARRARDRRGGRQHRRHRPGARQPRLRPRRRRPAGGRRRGGMGRCPHDGTARPDAVLRHAPAVRHRRIPVPARALGCERGRPSPRGRTSGRSGSTRSSSRSCSAASRCRAAGSPRPPSACVPWRRSRSAPRTSSSSARCRRRLTELALWEGRPDDAASAGGDGDPPGRVHAGGPHRRGLRPRRPGQCRRGRARAGQALQSNRSSKRSRRGTPSSTASGAGTQEVVAHRPPLTAQSEAWLRLCEAEGTRSASPAEPGRLGRDRRRHGTGSGDRTWPRTRDTARRRPG